MDNLENGMQAENSPRELDKFNREHPKYILDWNRCLKRRCPSGSKHFYEDGMMRLYRIVYKDGTVGGWAEGYHNLSQHGDCRVLDNAKVYGYYASVSGNAVVRDDAKIYGCAKVFGNAEVSGKARISERAMVYEYAKAQDSSDIYGYARLYGNSAVSDSAKVFGTARVYGTAEIFGNAEIYGDSVICGTAKIYDRFSSIQVCD